MKLKIKKSLITKIMNNRILIILISNKNKMKINL